MYYTNLKQQKILDIINKFGCMSYKQIKKINDFRDLDKHLKTLLNHNKIKLIEENIYVPMAKQEANKEVIKALEVCFYLNSIDSKIPIGWCDVEKFPFTLAFFRNDKVFDISVVNQGKELIYSAAINRSIAERVIVIIEDQSEIEKIKINKQVKYCTMKDGAVIFL